MAHPLSNWCDRDCNTHKAHECAFDEKHPVLRVGDAEGHSYRVVEKGAEVTHGAQLQRKAQAIVVAATAHDLCAVVVAEMKAARQIVWRHHVGITAITITLRGSEKTDGY